MFEVHPASVETVIGAPHHFEVESRPAAVHVEGSSVLKGLRGKVLSLAALTVAQVHAKGKGRWKLMLV